MKTFLQYVSARSEEETERYAYRMYVTETLRGLTNTVGGYLGGATVTMSFEEVLNYKPETRSADEIKEHMKNKLRSLGGGGE